MIKRILAIAALSLFVFAGAVRADSDLVVSCQPFGDGGDCSVSPSNTPLFEIGDMKPAYRFYRNLTVINGNSQDDCHFYLSASESGSSILKPVLNNQIKRGSSLIYENPMSLLLGVGPVFIETIPATATYQYQWMIEMGELAGDDYQNKSLSFNLSLGFECGQAPQSPTATPTPGGDECTDAIPGEPINLSATSAGSGEIFLSWSPPTEGPVTGYLVAYGPSSENYIYGNPNVSGSPYLVTELTPGVMYYFAVKALNGCAIGLDSNEATALAGGGFVEGVVVEGPAPGFDILGESEESADEGEVAGGTSVAGASEGRWCYWSLLFTLLAIVLSMIILHRGKKREKKQMIYPVVLSILAYLADRFMHQWFYPSIFCVWMWLMLFFVLLLSWAYWRRKAS